MRSPLNDASTPHNGPGTEAMGLWLNGARGSVATTAIVGLLALRAGVTPATGCVTDQPPLSSVALPEWQNIVVGGHDIVDTPLEKRAEQLVDGGVIPQPVLDAVRDALPAVEDELRTGYHPATHEGTLAEAAQRLESDIARFQARHGLRHVVVVNVSATEAPFPASPEHDDLAALDEALARPGHTALPPSAVCAYAAFRAGCGFVDFTPSTGARLPALEELAVRQGVPFAGSDGKTGETLLRTVLAPMFAARHLRVRSWAGVNLLGGGDGANLADPVNVASKLTSKSGVLPSLLGEEVTDPLHIDNVPDLGDHKTSWDHVLFEGFLGVRMTMQLTWEGIDSTLAAPLVLDLARLVAQAHASGLSGPLPELGFFFKDPVGTGEHGLMTQQSILVDWANRLGAEGVG